MNNVYDLTLVNRLETCAKRAGGKKNLAELSQISQPQLFRYFKPGSSIPSDRLMAIARAANVHPYWLLSGKGGSDVEPIQSFASKDDNLAIDAHMFTECIRLVEQLQKEYGFELTPTHKGQVILAMYKGFFYESRIHGKSIIFDTSKALEIMAYFFGIQGELPRQMLANTIEVMEDIAADKLPEKEIQSFANYLATATTNYYTHPTVGQPYFDRMGYELTPQTITWMEEFIAEIRKQHMFSGQNIRLLDLGCGNGRHLSFFAQFPFLTLKGVDNNPLAIRFCTQLEKAGKLPKDTFIEADMRTLPFPDKSFDLVFCNASLFHLPYLPDHDIGFHAQMQEILRVLKPKGHIYIHGRHGRGFEPFPFFQLHNEGTMRETCHKHGLQLLWFHKYFWKDSMEYIPNANFNDWFTCLLRKPS